MFKMFYALNRADYPEGRKRYGIVTETAEEGYAVLWPDMPNVTRWYREGELQPFRFVIGDKVKFIDSEDVGVVIALDKDNDPIVKWDMCLAVATHFTNQLLLIAAAPNSSIGCPHTNIREVPLGIGPAAKIIWVCMDCKKECNNRNG